MRSLRATKDLGPLPIGNLQKCLGGRPALTQRSRCLRCALWLVLLVAVAVRPAEAQVAPPQPDMGAAINVSAAAGSRWIEGAYEVWHLAGDCLVEQDGIHHRSREAMLWIERGGEFGARRNKMIVFLEGDVIIAAGAAEDANRITDATWLGRFYSTAPLSIRLERPGREPQIKPPIYYRAIEARNAAPLESASQATPAEDVQLAQFVAGEDAPAEASLLPPGMRRLRAFRRSDVPFELQSYNDPARDEWVVVISRGVNLLVDGLEGVGLIDVSADRIVIWTRGPNEPDLSGQTPQTDDTPLEIYMEGNVVFRQGDRVVYAERVFYDVPREAGIIVAAEVLTPVPMYQGFVRLKADLVQQLSRDRFYAQNAFLTTSRMGFPGYRIQASDLYLEDLQIPLTDPFTGAPQVDPLTGEQVIAHNRLATARNNVLFLGRVPVFYWPVLATDPADPQFYITELSVENDNVFGTWVHTAWDVYQLLGWDNPPAGTDWDVSFDYLTERGFGYGTNFNYSRADLFGVPGPYSGFTDFWAIDDQGLDNLGLGRRALPPEVDYRYRVLSRHRHLLPRGFQFTGEVGVISDRNFLEQYYENEWDEFKDQTTGFELKQLRDNMSWSVTSDYRVNDFFTQTDWLPRADHFWLGQRLGEWFTWYEHTSVGYGRLQIFEPSPNPADFATLMPWEVPSRGERAVTRHEIDLPLQVGPFRVVPYALGEAGHWGEDLAGNDLQRLYGQAGVRASLPFWSINPAAENHLLNVHGLAHKIVFDVDGYVAEANRDLDEFPLYDPVDDDSIEAFRRRFITTTYGGFVPLVFDERYYAVRSGLASAVTSPSAEIADDLIAVRLGARQRWQTKRGLPGQRRIIDWIVFDTQFAIFPNADPVTVGDNVGLLDYDFRWHVGDRLTLLSDGIFDFFTDGQQQVSAGFFLNRPPRGDLYAGFRWLDGPIENKVLIGSYNYRMSPKWAATMSTAVDVAGQGNIGQRVALTRIGESLLFTIGLNVDHSKDNVGVNLAVQPRFLSGARVGSLGGAQILPAGLYGLE